MVDLDEATLFNLMADMTSADIKKATGETFAEKPKQSPEKNHGTLALIPWQKRTVASKNQGK